MKYKLRTISRLYLLSEGRFIKQSDYQKSGQGR